MPQYRVVVLDDDDVLRSRLVECLKFTGFDARGYGEAEQVLSEVFKDGFSAEAMPDLLLLDLQLQEGKMEAIQLLRRLAELDVPTEILAIAGESGNSDIVEAAKLGATTGTAKPFENIYQFFGKLERFAEIGLKRRQYRIANRRLEKTDPSRRERPVFLSYAHPDRTVAICLKRHLEGRGIGVWYAASDLQPGIEWLPRIQEAVDGATIFICVITDNYAASKGVAELSRFHRRMATTPALTILPVLNKLSEKERQSVFIKPILDYQYIDLTDRFIDNLSSLLIQVEMILGGQAATERKAAARESA